MMVCDPVENGLAQGEVQVGLFDGDLGIAHTPCPRNSVSLGAGGSAIIEAADLYGRIQATGTLRGSFALSSKCELYLAIEGVRYDSIIAPIASSGIGPGYTNVGASTQVIASPMWLLAVQGKAVLPTAFTLDRHSWPLAVDAGAVLAWSPADRWVVHGSLFGMYGMALGGGPLFPTAGVTLNLGGEWRPTNGFGLVLDARTGFGYTAVVDVVSAGVGVRGAIGPHAGLTLEAVAPLAGAERRLAALDLRFDWRL